MRDSLVETYCSWTRSQGQIIFKWKEKAFNSSEICQKQDKFIGWNSAQLTESQKSVWEGDAGYPEWCSNLEPQICNFKIYF